jgi:plasmid stabilization system protein ParE
VSSSFLLTPDAEDDLRAIVDYIAHDSPQNAVKVFDKIHAAVRKLASFPGMGHRRDDIADEALRVWPVYSFLIFYRPQTRPLEVVRILHGARDIASVLGRRSRYRK